MNVPEKFIQESLEFIGSLPESIKEKCPRETASEEINKLNEIIEGFSKELDSSSGKKIRIEQVKLRKLSELNKGFKRVIDKIKKATEPTVFGFVKRKTKEKIPGKDAKAEKYKQALTNFESKHKTFNERINNLWAEKQPQGLKGIVKGAFGLRDKGGGTLHLNEQEVKGFVSTAKALREKLEEDSKTMETIAGEILSKIKGEDET